MRRTLPALCSLAVLLLVPRLARADGASLAVLEFSGPRAAAVRTQVVSGLEARDGVELVALSELLATAEEEGVDDLGGRALARVCAPLHLGGVLTGDVSGGSLRLTLRSCADGRDVEEVQVPLRRHRADAGRLDAALRRLVTRAGREATREDGADSARSEDRYEDQGQQRQQDQDREEREEDDDRAQDEDADEEADDDADEDPGEAPERARVGRGSLMSLTAGLEMGGRSFHYTDPITDNLRPYQLFGAPSVALSGELYPLARSDVPVLRDVGLTASYALAFALSSTLEGAEKVDTSWSRLQAGLRLRVRTGRGGPGFGLTMGYGMTKFGFAGATSAPVDELPDVDYSFLRAGLDARVPVGRRVILTAAGAYLLVLSTGALDDRFPRSSAGGADASLGVLWRLSGPLAVSFALAYTRFFFTMNPEPGDPYVAGGALDEYLGLRVGASYAN